MEELPGLELYSRSAAVESRLLPTLLGDLLLGVKFESSEIFSLFTVQTGLGGPVTLEEL